MRRRKGSPQNKKKGEQGGMNTRFLGKVLYFVAVCFFIGALFGLLSGKTMLAIAFFAAVPCLIAAGQVFDPDGWLKKRKNKK
jgi:hypothetical protein